MISKLLLRVWIWVYRRFFLQLGRITFSSTHNETIVLLQTVGATHNIGRSTLTILVISCSFLLEFTSVVGSLLLVYRGRIQWRHVPSILLLVHLVLLKELMSILSLQSATSNDHSIISGGVICAFKVKTALLNCLTLTILFAMRMRLTIMLMMMIRRRTVSPVKLFLHDVGPIHWNLILILWLLSSLLACIVAQRGYHHIMICQLLIRSTVKVI